MSMLVRGRMRESCWCGLGPSHWLETRHAEGRVFVVWGCRVTPRREEQCKNRSQVWKRGKKKKRRHERTRIMTCLCSPTPHLDHLQCLESWFTGLQVCTCVLSSTLQRYPCIVVLRIYTFLGATRTSKLSGRAHRHISDNRGGDTTRMTRQKHVSQSRSALVRRPGRDLLLC
jgi:hypothetical protein